MSTLVVLTSEKHSYSGLVFCLEFEKLFFISYAVDGFAVRELKSLNRF